MTRLVILGAAATLILGTVLPTAAAHTPNRKPDLAPIPDQQIDEGTQLTFTAVAVDPEGDPVSFSIYPASKVPPGATIGPTSGIFTWTPSEAQGPDSYTFSVSANDDRPGKGAAEKVTITVAEVNLAPVVSPLPDRADDVGSTVSFTASATDPDVPANDLAWSVTGLPPGINMDDGVFSGAPTTAGQYQVAVSVVDDGEPVLSGLVLFSWTVADPGGSEPPGNSPPSIAAIADRSDVEGSSVSVPVSVTDPDGDPVTVSASGLPPGVAVAGSDRISGTLGAGAAAESPYTVTVTARDPSGAEVMVSFAWAVTAPAPPPEDPPPPDEGGDVPGNEPPGAGGIGDPGPGPDEPTSFAVSAAGHSRGRGNGTLSLGIQDVIPAVTPALPPAEDPTQSVRRDTTPLLGLAVGFRTAVEGVRQSVVPNLAIVGLVTVLGILGIREEPRWRRKKRVGSPAST